MSTSIIWGENRHTLAHIRGLAVLAGVCLRANETEISTTQWAHVAWGGLYFYYF